MIDAYLLLNLAKISAKKQMLLMEFFGSSENFYNSFKNCKDLDKILLPEEISALFDVDKSNKVETHKKGLSAISVGVICIDDEKYPESLRSIFDPPTLLYYKGDISLLKTDSISIVGTRVCTRYGAEQAHDFAFALSKANFTIVSGLAEGIDSHAHKGALDANGKTIAVLAGGLNKIYPAINEGLSEDILKNGGLLISENPPSYLPKGFNFVQRNRIIAGLSLGVFVPEAGIKSGAFHTVNFANDNGRSIFVLPGRVDSRASEGTNNLIKNLQGACVVCPDDIICEFENHKIASVGKKQNANKPSVQLSMNEQLILNVLKIEELHFDEIAKKTNLDTKTLNSLLTTMQIRGLIKKLAGNFFSI